METQSKITVLQPNPSSFFKDLQSRLEQGDRISKSEALILYKEASLPFLGELAQNVKHRHNSCERVTFLIDRNINYTNVCNSDCSFCGFYRHDPKHPEAYVLSKEIIAKKVEDALAFGATRILLQGGHNDELPYDYYLDLISWLNEKYEIELNAFSPSEIEQMKLVSGKTYIEILEDLKQEGLAGLPGGGAEILDDQVRQRVSPKKIGAAKWIEIMEVAQGLELTTTATMVIGFGESLDNRLNHFELLRSLQDRSTASGLLGFNAFISWPLQFNENTSMGRSRHSKNYGVSSAEYLRNLAMARIYLDNIVHHQSSWPTCGTEIAAVGLHFGCDDFGSTMMEENVVSQAGAPTEYQCSMTPQELISHIQAAGFNAAQRDSSFRILREFD